MFYFRFLFKSCGKFHCRLRAKISSSEDELKKIKELMTNADKEIEDKSFEVCFIYCNIYNILLQYSKQIV